MYWDILEVITSAERTRERRVVIVHNQDYFVL